MSNHMHCDVPGCDEHIASLMAEPVVAMGDDYTTDEARLLATAVDLLSRILAVLREQRVILQGLADRG